MTEGVFVFGGKLSVADVFGTSRKSNCKGGAKTPTSKRLIYRLRGDEGFE